MELDLTCILFPSTGPQKLTYISGAKRAVTLRPRVLSENSRCVHCTLQQRECIQQQISQQNRSKIPEKKITLFTERFIVYIDMGTESHWIETVLRTQELCRVNNWFPASTSSLQNELHFSSSRIDVIGSFIDMDMEAWIQKLGYLQNSNQSHLLVMLLARKAKGHRLVCLFG